VVLKVARKLRSRWSAFGQIHSALAAPQLLLLSPGVAPALDPDGGVESETLAKKCLSCDGNDQRDAVLRLMLDDAHTTARVFDFGAGNSRCTLPVF